MPSILLNPADGSRFMRQPQHRSSEGARGSCTTASSLRRQADHDLARVALARFEHLGDSVTESLQAFCELCTPDSALPPEKVMRLMERKGELLPGFRAHRR
jgi:hypothetical protein